MCVCVSSSQSVLGVLLVQTPGRSLIKGWDWRTDHLQELTCWSWSWLTWHFICILHRWSLVRILLSETNEWSLTILVRAELRLHPGRSVFPALSPHAQHPHAQIVQIYRGKIADALGRRLAHRHPVLPVLRPFQFELPGNFAIRRKNKLKKTHWFTMAHRLLVIVTKHSHQ